MKIKFFDIYITEDADDNHSVIIPTLQKESDGWFDVSPVEYTKICSAVYKANTTIPNGLYRTYPITKTIVVVQSDTNPKVWVDRFLEQEKIDAERIKKEKEEQAKRHATYLRDKEEREKKKLMKMLKKHPEILKDAVK